VALAIAGTISCGGDGASARIDVGQAETLALATGMRIGAVHDPVNALVEPIAAARHGDSLLYLTQWRVAQVRAYDTRTGKFRFAIGGRGSGPGEFAQPAELGLVGDTLWVQDGPEQAIELFTPAGGFLGSVRFRPRSPGAVAPTPRKLMSYQHVWTEPTIPVELLSRDTTIDLSLIRTNLDGDSLNVVAVQQLHQTYARLDVAGRYMSLARSPFAPGELMAWSAKARRAAMIAAESELGYFTLTLTDIEGDTVAELAFRTAPKEITSERRTSAIGDFYRTRRIAERGIELAAFQRAAESQMAIAEYESPVTRLVAGRDGSWWLELGPMYSDSVDWLILDGDGRSRGRVRLPGGFHLLDADLGTIWGVVRDENDVPFLQQYVVNDLTGTHAFVPL
jgi:hypothetical protein